MSDAVFTESAYTGKLNEHKLMGTRCTSCGSLFLPPRPMCADCYDGSMEWVELPTTGTIEAFTSVFIGPTAMIEAGYDRKNPYCVGIVKLDEGPAISAQILGVDPTHPESIKVGTKVKATFVERGDGEGQRTFLAFQADDA